MKVGNKVKEARMITCPECKETIDKVGVTSQCWQYATLEGNTISMYGSIEEIEKTLSVWCPKCTKDITKSIKTE